MRSNNVDHKNNYKDVYSLMDAYSLNNVYSQLGLQASRRSNATELSLKTVEPYVIRLKTCFGKWTTWAWTADAVKVDE